jgi:hypothetical protein
LKTESQLARLHSEIKALESRVSGWTGRTADSADPHEARNTVPLSPMAVELSANTFFFKCQLVFIGLLAMQLV